MKKQTLRMLANILIAVLVPLAWAYMVFSRKDGTLSSTGLRSLRYFTVLSNLLEGVCSILLLLSFRISRLRRAAEVGKYIAAVAVALTFSTVMLALGPLYGYPGMFRGANFWFHLVIPLAAMAEYTLLGEAPMGNRENLWAVAPLLLYGAVYACVNLFSGPPYPFDMYGFMRWGLPAGLGVFALLTGLAFLLGLAMRKINRALLRSR